MLAELRAAIKAKLESTHAFRAVEAGFSRRVLQSPPSAAFFLVIDQKVADDPTVARVLTYEIALLVGYADPEKAQEQIEDIVDAVRGALTGWLPAEHGCGPATVPEFKFHGVEGTLLIYTGRMTIEVYPETLFN